MTACVVWSQPDPNHFNRLCTNTFRRNTSPGVFGDDCQLCVEPKQPYPTCESQLPQFHICRNFIDGEYISTWTPFFTFTITLPSLYRTGAPWYYGTTGNCDSFYIGSFTLGTLNWKCGRWTTFLTDPDERYKKQLTGGCTDRTEDFRIDLFWSSTNPVLEAIIRYRIFTTNYSIICRYSAASPLLHDCRKPISFQTWRNTGGDWTGSTAFSSISSTPGASVTLTPLYL